MTTERTVGTRLDVDEGVNGRAAMRPGRPSRSDATCIEWTGTCTRGYQRTAKMQLIVCTGVIAWQRLDPETGKAVLITEHYA
jgi:hypothetical protein